MKPLAGSLLACALGLGLEAAALELHRPAGTIDQAALDRAAGIVRVAPLEMTGLGNFRVTLPSLEMSGLGNLRLQTQPLVMTGLGGVTPMANPNAVQRYQVRVAPLRMSGRGDASRVGKPAAGDGRADVQRYQIRTAPLRMSGRIESGGEEKPVSESAKVQRYQIRTAPLRMSGRIASSEAGKPVPVAGESAVQRFQVQTAPLRMSGRSTETQRYRINVAPLRMSGRGDAQSLGGANDAPREPRVKFRLFRVVPLGAGGTNPFDHRDVRADVVVALAGGSVTAPLDPGAVVVVPVTPTALTLSAALPGIEVRAGTPAHIQLDTVAQTISTFYNGVSQPITPTTALSLSLNLIGLGNVTGTLDAVPPWTVASRGYAQPFNTSLTTCTVLRYSDGVYYKVNLGLSETATGYLMTSLSATRHGTSQPTCP